MRSKPDLEAPRLISSGLWWILILAVLVGLLVAIALPNFVHSGPGKFTGIVSRLQQIDGAKEQWAIDHGFTNSARLNLEITKTDLTPYLLRSFTQKDFGDPQYGERYFIKRLNESPEAILTTDFKEEYGSGFSLPKGTIIRLLGSLEQIILPHQTTNQTGKN